MDLRGYENSHVSQRATEGDYYDATTKPDSNTLRVPTQALSICQNFEYSIAPNCTRPFSGGFLQGRRGVFFIVFLVGVFRLADISFYNNARAMTILTENERRKHDARADDMESQQNFQVRSNEHQAQKQGLRGLDLQQAKGKHGIIEGVQDNTPIFLDQMPPTDVYVMQSDKETEKMNVDFEMPHLHGFRGIFEERDQESDVPIFWHIPKAGGSTIKDIVGTCHSRVIANENGVLDGHGTDAVSAVNVVMHVIIVFGVTQ